MKLTDAELAATIEDLCLGLYPATIHDLASEVIEARAEIAQLTRERDEARELIKEAVARRQCDERCYIDSQDTACLLEGQFAEDRLALIARIAKLEEALTAIRYINHGPDKASSEWRCVEAAQIARNALEETSSEKCDASSVRADTQNNS